MHLDDPFHWGPLGGIVAGLRVTQSRRLLVGGDYTFVVCDYSGDRIEDVILYRPGTGSAGFRGRTGIYELVIVDDQMRTMIHDEAPEHELERYARTLTPSIRDDGLARVLRGETTLEEVLRVTRED